MGHPAEKLPETTPEQAAPPVPAPAPRDDVTLTLFDALQATKPSHRHTAKAQNAIEIVGVSEEPAGFAGLPISPRLVLALAVTLVLTLGVLLFPRSTKTPSTAQRSTPSTAAAAKPASPTGLPTGVYVAPPAPPLPKFSPQVQRGWNNLMGGGAASNLSNEERDREKERERDREYEREREREKRRQMDAWRANDSAPTLTRPSEDPGLIENARGYKDPGAVLRERDRPTEDR